MNKELFQVNLAVVMGIGIGALLCVFGQKAINAYSIHTCPSKPDHVLVRMTNSFVGDAVYCVERKYV
jgi:hypothetical protein